MVMPYHLHMPSYFLETFTEYRLSCNSWGITLCNFPFMHTPLLIYTGRTSYLPLHEMKP